MTTKATIIAVDMAAILAAFAVGWFVGILYAIDPQHYGPVDRLELKPDAVCKIYERSAVDVYICGNEISAQEKR